MACKTSGFIRPAAVSLLLMIAAGGSGTTSSSGTGKPLSIRLAGSKGGAVLELDGFVCETPKGKFTLHIVGTEMPQVVQSKTWRKRIPTDEGFTVDVLIRPKGSGFMVSLETDPDSGAVGWGLSVRAVRGEYFTGLMERVVDGPQNASWKPGIKEAMDLRGQKVDMIVKPTTSVYAPFYLSSRGYALSVEGNWPGFFDFCATDTERVHIVFEGPSLGVKFYLSSDPAELVRRHALDAGPPFLPPRWAFTPWRWRDEHTQRTEYYDGTAVTGPFNSEVMEDVFMMKAYGIPCGIYWVDRPYGPGRLGYDDFEIDPKRLPHFKEMVEWLNGQDIRMMLWIGPFFQGKMEQEALIRNYTLAGQSPRPNNYPLADFTNPKAKAYWQNGLAKLLELGVSAFKLDRSEEDIPESGPYRVWDGRSIRENRNAYPPMFTRAAYEVVRKHRGKDFLLMPRAAYTGSSAHAMFWGGDIGGTQEGLRASIVAVQRAAVMGYPLWGSDTGGYNQQLMEQEVVGRWLAFSCFTPVMEVGPTRNRAFWNLPRQPAYDTTLIAIWRLYARLHMRLADYTYGCAKAAHKTGLPIVRPLFLAEPASVQAWANWWTYLYGPDILVSPVWEKEKREQEVYLPRGARWENAWEPGTVYDGGQSVTVRAELHQIPIFVRLGSNPGLGDLNGEYLEAMAAAGKRPDLAALDAEAKAWFDVSQGGDKRPR